MEGGREGGIGGGREGGIGGGIQGGREGGRYFIMTGVENQPLSLSRSDS
jgi:hypothetical protein